MFRNRHGKICRRMKNVLMDNISSLWGIAYPGSKIAVKRHKRLKAFEKAMRNGGGKDGK